MSHNFLDVERLERFFRGEFTKDDSDYLRQMFCDKLNEGGLENIVRKKWHEILKGKDNGSKNLDHILYRIHYEINSGEPLPDYHRWASGMIKWYAGIAALILLPLLIYSGIYFSRNARKDINVTWVELTAPAWTRVQFSLPDGSYGWLNSSSSIRYCTDFKIYRKLELDGEAFFNVKTDPDKPFIVSTKEINVTALGTRFNIASYENEADVEIVLEEGKLFLDNTEMDMPIEMNPNDLIIYNKITYQLSKEVIQPQIYLAWTEGKLVFRNDPIDVVARRLGRWYNVGVEVSGNNFENVRLRATFVDENLEEVLYFLKRALPLDYKIIKGGMDADDETYIKKKIIFSMRK